MNTQLYTRDATPFNGQFSTDKKGLRYFVRERVCRRCGGQGGSEAWKLTGWTCYDCGGSGRRGTEAVLVYTGEELGKLDATAEKRQATKQAKADAKAAAEAAATMQRREAFLAEHGDLLASAQPYAARSDFLRDVLAKADSKAWLSEAQAQAIRNTVAKFAEADAQRAQHSTSRHVGTVGERLTVDVTVDRVASFSRPSFRTGREETVWIITMRDAEGNAIVSKSPSFHAEQGAKLTIAATVKEHADYRGEAQTVVQRVSVK